MPAWQLSSTGSALAYPLPVADIINRSQYFFLLSAVMGLRIFLSTLFWVADSKLLKLADICLCFVSGKESYTKGMFRQ